MPTDEEWKPVVGFTGYEVSDRGRVRSFRRHPEGRLLALVAPWGSKKYLKVGLTRCGKQYNCEIHRLVAEAFIGECPAGHQVRHLDGDPLNNHPSNLSYGTPKQNCEDKRAHGTLRRGEDINTAALTESEVLEIRTLLSVGFRPHEIAGNYGVQGSCISKIKRGRTWKHVQDQEMFCGTVG